MAIAFQEFVIASPDTALGATFPPENSISLSFQGCQKLEFVSRILNFLPRLQSLSVNNTNKLVMRSMIYDSRIGTGESIHLKDIKIAQVTLPFSKLGQLLQIFQNLANCLHIFSSVFAKNLLLKMRFKVKNWFLTEENFVHNVP